MSLSPIALGVNLITFYDPAYWGLEGDLGYYGFVDSVSANPKPYWDRMLDNIQRSGFVGVEFSAAPGRWTDALSAYGSAGAVGDELSRRGLTLISSYMAWWELIGNDLDNVGAEAEIDAFTERHAAFVRELGCDTIVMGTLGRSAVGSFDKVSSGSFERVAYYLNRIGRIIGEYGVKLSIHTDAYSVCCRADDVDTLMRMTKQSGVALLPDAGQMVLDGVDPCEVLRRNVGRVFAMHWKDCVGALPGRSLSADAPTRHDLMLKYFRVLGSGIVNWREWMGILLDANWKGWAVAEIDMAADPMGELAKFRAYFRNELSSIYGA